MFISIVQFTSDVRSRDMSWSRDRLETDFEGLGLGLGLENKGLGLGLGLVTKGLGLGLGLEPFWSRKIRDLRIICVQMLKEDSDLDYCQDVN